MTRRQLSLSLLVALFAVVALAVSTSHGQAVDRIDTGAGTGTAGFGGDGGPATTALLNTPSDVSPQADGDFFIADTANDRIRRVSAAGAIATVPGPSAELTLNAPRGVAALSDGGFLIADTGNNLVRLVSAAGTVTNVAGTGTAGFSGDRGAATEALLNAPQGVAALPDGSILIADTGNNRIRRVSDGVITTVAGTGPAAFNGDGAPATRVALNAPARVAPLAGGGFLIADTGNDRIRRVDTAGNISTIAGTGTAGFAGDGGPATAAQLDAPQGIAVRADGSLVVADTANDRVRAIAADGTIRTIAGTGAAGFSGDGGPASAARLAGPRAVAQGTGRLLVADTANHRIRAITTVAPQPDSGVPATLPQPAEQPPPGVAPPTIGANAVVAPVAGKVRVRLAGHRGFVALTGAENVGLGSELDATKGAVAVFFITTKQGRAASAIASGGRFLLLQPDVLDRNQRPGLLSLSARLTGCPRRAATRVHLLRSATARAARKGSPRRRVRVHARGRIRTKGRYGSAIVRGTQWTIQDQCPPIRPAGTKFVVTEGIVSVRDFVKHRSVLVRAGRRYLARARVR
ncbi:NHL domain-containing protein [Capillimicrobium parvum]|uniref:Virginiamycin B lyase n=1 Tax=Capillimicrobium parvum TaxID=2884022 RepID=A0A9E6Y5X5_9ACTN|nr:hypothetical protein [Capillimicrobium parvum]UGS39221.1 Virginiamycin B lyase [Capillimicrobium parvum]